MTDFLAESLSPNEQKTLDRYLVYFMLDTVLREQKFPAQYEDVLYLALEELQPEALSSIQELDSNTPPSQPLWSDTAHAFAKDVLSFVELSDPLLEPEELAAERFDKALCRLTDVVLSDSTKERINTLGALLYATQK